ncbi:hypothetical protein LRP50_18155 [Enterovibrio sp. ZSDZ42]|uniref:Uncharacterized protein n=1 Tax=Enterovibrio gelatinilyticus TaxID=2899819 RepID=A0ABT5R450_9GAMM|nr:hypothetical protein [Enterovibrio sp. ZSDZ42]MDD1795054.1 hypothetical protein [Enterovibrio sp. ZSDZ42]
MKIISNLRYRAVNFNGIYKFKDGVYELTRIVCVLVTIVIIAVSVNEISGRDSLLSRLEKERVDLLFSLYKDDIRNDDGRKRYVSSSDMDTFKVTDAMIEELRFLIVHGKIPMSLVRDEILEYKMLAPHVAIAKIDDRIRANEIGSLGALSNEAIKIINYKKKSSLLGQDVDSIRNNLDELDVFQDYLLNLNVNGYFDEGFWRSYVEDYEFLYGENADKRLLSIKEMLSGGGGLEEFIEQVSLEVSLEKNYENASLTAKKIELELVEETIADMRIGVDFSDGSFFSTLYLEGQSNDTLLLMIFISSGVLGATIVTMQKNDVFLSVELVLIGLTTGVILYFAVKGGPKIFVDEVLSRGVSTSNPYSCALFGLLGGLFSDKVHKVLEMWFGSNHSRGSDMKNNATDPNAKEPKENDKPIK